MRPPRRSAGSRPSAARVHATGASLVIEATEPVPYMTTPPDPLTVAARLPQRRRRRRRQRRWPSKRRRHCRRRRRARSNRMGVPIARVRISLAQPVAHHVRSDRNTVVIDFERSPRAGVPSVMPAAVGGPARRDAGARPGRCAVARSRSDRRAARHRRAQRAAGAGRGRSCLAQRRAGRQLLRRPRPLAQQPAQRQPPGDQTGPARAAASTPATRSASISRARPARRAAHVRRDQRPQHRHRSDGAGHGRRRAARRARGIRRSTSSCAPTSSATSSTARSSASRR